MAELISYQDESIYGPMSREFDLDELISEVFTAEEERVKFVNALIEIKSMLGDKRLMLGGRTLRGAMGITTKDYTVEIKNKVFGELERKLLGPLVDVLENYPFERMFKADLDFFYDGKDIAPQKIVGILIKHGLSAEVRIATGGIPLIVITASGGEATFVNMSDSYQQSEVAIWPKFGIKAEFDANSRKFVLNSYRGSLLVYPLWTRLESGHGPIEPQRLTTVSRILLWLLTAKDPFGQYLKLPDLYTQNLILKSVFYAWKRIDTICDSGNKNYTGSVRDLALGMYILLLSDLKSLGFPQEHIRFFDDIKVSWPPTGLAVARYSRNLYLQYSILDQLRN